MIFHHLKYVNPTWYFNLKPKTDHGYFPTIQQCNEVDLSLDIDSAFKSLWQDFYNF